MADLNIADIFIIITLALSTIIGIYRGFIRELLTIITWIIAGFVAYMYGKMVGDYFFFLNNPTTKEIVGMVTVFIAVVLIGFIIKVIVVKAGKISGVSKVDRLTGALFGALRGCLIVILLLLVSPENINKQEWYKKSQMLPKFAKVSDMIANATPKEWKEEISKEVEEVREDIEEALTAEQAPAPTEKAKPASKSEKTTTTDSETTTKKATKAADTTTKSTKTKTTTTKTQSEAPMPTTPPATSTTTETKN